MEIKIEWTELSSKQLNDIYDYYFHKASPRIAKEIITKLLIELKFYVKIRYPVLKKNF